MGGYSASVVLSRQSLIEGCMPFVSVFRRLESKNEVKKDYQRNTIRQKDCQRKNIRHKVKDKKQTSKVKGRPDEYSKNNGRTEIQLHQRRDRPYLRPGISMQSLSKEREEASKILKELDEGEVTMGKRERETKAFLSYFARIKVSSIFIYEIPNSFSTKISSIIWGGCNNK